MRFSQHISGSRDFDLVLIVVIQTKQILHVVDADEFSLSCSFSASNGCLPRPLSSSRGIVSRRSFEPGPDIMRQSAAATTARRSLRLIVAKADDHCLYTQTYALQGAATAIHHLG